MELPTAKQIKALAKACRASGIRSFKGGGIEFTLDAAMIPRVSKNIPNDTQEEIKEDALEGDALLFWSADNTDNQPET